MKRHRIVRACHRLLLILVTGGYGALPARAANEGPHGGDYIASQFVQRGNEVLLALREARVDAGLVTPAELDAIANAIVQTPVNSVEAPLYDPRGDQVDALTVSDPDSPTGKVI